MGKKIKKSWAMFTKRGDAEVSKIVKSCLDYEMAYKRLETLAKTKGFEEATDTAVRDLVYEHYFPSPKEERKLNPREKKSSSTKEGVKLYVFREEEVGDEGPIMHFVGSYDTEDTALKYLRDRRDGDFFIIEGIERKLDITLTPHELSVIRLV